MRPVAFLKQAATRWGSGLAVLIAFALGFAVSQLMEPASVPGQPGGGGVASSDSAAPKEVWTCSMHPLVRRDGPGLCPLCSMDLIPVSDDGGGEDVGERHFTTSAAAHALMDIQTALVERRDVAAEIRMVGKVVYDETRLGYITAWVPGRLDRLYVDYTGVRVSEGDHMVYLYSPELITAQEELRRALKSVKNLRTDSPSIIRTTATETLKAVRRKLTLWGLTEAQIRDAEESGELSDHITIYAPMGGTIVHMNAQQGMYVETGTRIYTIADLSHLWVQLDAYESDLRWIHYGQKLEFTSEAWPGEVMEGTVAFIAPLLDEATRTVKVRVNVANADGKLKPGMFVRGVVRAELASGGRAMAPELAGKLICPMHPEIVKDEPAPCDICGMDLVSSEELGFVSIGDAEAPLVIPSSAPLITGKRAIVYVEVPGRERPTYEGRVVVLGPRAGDFYLVEEGLVEGERVVTNGNFKIDSALQILAKPSMMSSEASELPDSFEVPAAFRKQLRAVVDSYFALQAALTKDDVAGAVAAAKALHDDAIAKVDMTLLRGDARDAWTSDLAVLGAALGAMLQAKDLGVLRTEFDKISKSLTAAVDRFGLGDSGVVYEMNCPMAFDWRGANWLQDHKAVRNPYFGTQMLECGSQVRALGQEPSPPAMEDGSHSKGDGNE